MAINLIERVYNAQKSSVASWDCMVRSVELNEVAILAIVADNSGTNGVSAIGSMNSDSKIAWTERLSINRTSGTALDGVSLKIFSGVGLVTEASPGSTYTISFSPNVTAKAALVYRFDETDGSRHMEYVSIPGSTTGNGSNPSITGGTTDVNDLLIGFLGIENLYSTITGDADTDGGSWSALAGQGTTGSSGASNVAASGQYKIATSSAAQTFNPTDSAAVDYCIATVLCRTVLTEIPFLARPGMVLPRPAVHRAAVW